jgi:hypothetical protein
MKYAFWTRYSVFVSLAVFEIIKRYAYISEHVYSAVDNDLTNITLLLIFKQSFLSPEFKIYMYIYLIV